MAPSSPTFSPRTANFNNQSNVTLNFTSSDGVLQQNDLESADIYVNGVRIPYNEDPVYVDGDYFSYESSVNGSVTINSFIDDEGSDAKAITKAVSITKIVFDEVTYMPS